MNPLITLTMPFARKVAAVNKDVNEDTTIYKVVVNHEERYSIWSADRENALAGVM